MGGGSIEAGSHRQGMMWLGARMVANKMLGSAGDSNAGGK